MTSTAFAVVWEKPVPQTTPLTTVKNVSEGKTMYLYNADYKGFYHGANEYGTRASVGNTGLPIKIVEQASGKYAIYYVAKKDYASPDGAESIWIDGKRSNYNGWTITTTTDNYFKLAVPAVLKNGTLGILSTAFDTRLNLLTPNAATKGAKIYDTWAMVTTEDYQAWHNLNEVYLVAVKLGDTIKAAKKQFPKIDLKAEEAVYNNTSSNKQQLEAAIKSTVQKLKATIETNASAKKPQDMTSFIVNHSFEDANTNGWTVKESDDTGAKENTNATYHVDNADGNYIFNTWSAGYAITQTLESMPNGVYKLQALVTSSDDCTNVYLLGNNTYEAITLLGNPKTGSKQTYFTTGEMMFYTTNGKVTIGACGSANDGKSYSKEGVWWYKADNFRLTYYGNAADAWTFALDEYKKTVAIAEGTKVSKPVREEWENTLNNLAPTDAKSYNSAIETIKKARVAVDENIATWTSYIELATQAEQLLKDDNCRDAAIDLKEYLQYTYSPYVEQLDLTTEEIKAEIASLEDLFEEAKTITPAGTAVTSMIVNPDFAKGWDHWVHTGSGTVRADNIAKCAEAWKSENFDIHQDIENVPVGVYEVKVQGFYRYLRGNNAWNAYFNSDGTKKTTGVSEYITNTPAKIYINDNTSPMANVFDCSVTPEYAAAHWTKNDYYTDPNKKKCYPNNMTDSGEAFDRGEYETSAIGLVTKKGDILRIGMKGNSNQGGDSWAIFTRFKLIYQGYNTKVLEPALKNAINTVNNNDLLIGSDIIAEINKAVKDGNEAIKKKEGKKMFNTLAAIYALKDKISDSEAIFKNLKSKLEDFKKVVSNKSGSANQSAVTDANNLITEITNAINNKTYTNAQANEDIKRMTAAEKKLSMPASIENASDDKPVDITMAITNNSFETGDLTGWSIAKGTSDTGVKQNTSTNYTISNAAGSYIFNTWNASAIEGGFFVSQDIEYLNLPAGTYELKCLVASDNNNTQKVSVNKYYTDVKTSGKQTGKRVSVIFKLNDNDNISIKVASSSWFKADDFQLIYYGRNSNKTTSLGIEDVQTDPTFVNGIYTANGIKVAELQKGVNIVRTNKGVKKIMKLKE